MLGIALFRLLLIPYPGVQLISVVGNESNGMTLGVVSLLARMGVDPWSEVGRLATLPKDAAEGGSPRQSPAPQKA